MAKSTITKTVSILGAAAAICASLAAPASAQPRTAAAPSDTGSAITTSGAKPSTAYQRQHPAPTQGRKAGPASPTAKWELDGYCDAYGNYGELCLYYTGFSSSLADFYYSDGNLGDNRFVSPGAGQGQVVANNSESAWNRDLVYGWTVYTGAHRTGTPGYIAPGEWGRFTSTFINNVESIYLT